MSCTCRLACDFSDMMVPACSNIILLLYSVISLLCLTHGAGITILEGDVYVEGVFSLQSTVNKTCNNEHVEPEFVQNMESIRWTLGQLNKDTSNLYGKKIGRFICLYIHT